MSLWKLPEGGVRDHYELWTRTFHLPLSKVSDTSTNIAILNGALIENITVLAFHRFSCRFLKIPTNSFGGKMSVFVMWRYVEEFLASDQSMSRKSCSFPSSFLSFLTHPVAVGCLTSPGSILKKTFVNANGRLVFSQGLSLYKETSWYAFLRKIPQMLWGTSRIRANNPGLPRMKGIRYKPLKPSSQANCLCGLWMMFFFKCFSHRCIKSYESAACEAEGSAVGPCMSRMTGMQHVLLTWVCVPQADSRSEQPKVCAISSALGDGFCRGPSRLGAFHRA